MTELRPYLKALLALEVARAEKDMPDLRLEIILSRAGLSIQEIADVLGKTYPAVAKTLSRAGISGKRSGGGTE